MTIAILIIAMSSLAQETGTFTDPRDGKTYKTVKIGTQTWMAENLAYKASTGCWAYKDDQNNVTTYGYLYNWETAKNVCPSSWHLPSDAEWTTLTDFLGGILLAGGKLKSTKGWKSPNTGADNSSNFMALPGGQRYNSESFYDIGYLGYWWSASEFNSVGDVVSTWARYLSYDKASVGRYFYKKLFGYSVRCLKD
ncbi:MAG: hypothetical protein NTY07_17120 [Bacteroidia bacterium]|nr:hypothetical protein [Bacteroidia bacterium]